MKDIENMLSEHTPKPKRPLNDTFTEAVLSEIKTRPQLRGGRKLITNLRARLLNKAGITSLAGIVLLTGTAAALALWPKPTVIPTITKQLPSGNHIVGYDTRNCNYFDELNGGPVKPTNEKIYYEIRHGAAFTDQQLKDMLQGLCEENLSNAAISHIIKQIPKDTPPTESTESYIINAISKNSITVSIDPHLNTELLTTQPVQTYTHFSANLLIYNESTKVNFSDIKMGDSIKMIVQDTSGKSTETPDNYNPLNHPESIVILAILKTPPLTADPGSFYPSIGKDIVRVETCKTSPTGFCRIYNFEN